MNIFKHFIGISFFRVFRSDIIPTDHVIPLEAPDELLKRIYITHYKETVVDHNMGTIEIALKFKSEILFKLPGLEGFLFVFGNPKKTSRLTFIIEMGYDSFKVTFNRGPRIRFPRELFCPVNRRFRKWKIDNRRRYTEISIDRPVVIDQDWNIYFEGVNEYSFGPAVVNGTGIVLEAAVAVDLYKNRSIPESAARGLDETWRGVVSKQLTVSTFANGPALHLTKGIESPAFRIDGGGVSGDFIDNQHRTI